MLCTVLLDTDSRFLLTVGTATGAEVEASTGTEVGTGESTGAAVGLVGQKEGGEGDVDEFEEGSSDRTVRIRKISQSVNK